MIIPTGTAHDARMTASAVREVVCARCRNPFFFHLRRTGRGHSQTFFSSA